MERKTIFSGNFPFYESEFEKDVSYTGNKIGPGPATLNIADNKSHKYTISSHKTTLPQGPRVVGGHRASVQVPGPCAYPARHNPTTLKNSSVLRAT